MNRLTTEKRAQILGFLIDGNSLKATCKLADISINTVTKLLREVGEACANFHDKTVRNLITEYVRIDEILTFVLDDRQIAPNEKSVRSLDLWTWTAFDAATKLIVSWSFGVCNENTKQMFSREILERAGHPVQISFDSDSAIANKEILLPIDESKSHPLNMCVMIPTWLTTSISKKITNYLCAVAIQFVHYNFVKTHTTLRTTPAMNAGLMEKPMTLKEMVDLTIAFKKVPQNRLNCRI